MHHAEPTSRQTGLRESRSLARDALAIVLTGVVLGLAYNQAGLAARPPRGLPWVAVSVPLQSVDSLVRAGPRPVPPPAGIADPRSAPGAPARPAEGPRPGAHAGGEPASRPRAETRATVPGDGVAALEHEAATERAGPDAAVQAGLPAIPEDARPRKVGLATVALFVEAGAARVVDAREASEFLAGHIPGAINIPYDDAVRDPALLERLRAESRPVIVYCSGGSCEASAMLAEILVSELGLRRVLVYEAGYPEWLAAGKPVPKESP